MERAASASGERSFARPGFAANAASQLWALAIRSFAAWLLSLLARLGFGRGPLYPPREGGRGGLITLNPKSFRFGRLGMGSYAGRAECRRQFGERGGVPAKSIAPPIREAPAFQQLRRPKP